MISDERRDAALTYLINSDEECAARCANTERAKFKAESIRDAIFLRLDGTVTDRLAQAKIADEYQAAMSEYFDKLKDYEWMRNKRKTETIVNEDWRTEQANRRQGNV